LPVRSVTNKLPSGKKANDQGKFKPLATSCIV
jgi:hypothetical protein